jgi:hypothetical protein
MLVLLQSSLAFTLIFVLSGPMLFPPATQLVVSQMQAHAADCVAVASRDLSSTLASRHLDPVLAVMGIKGTKALAASCQRLWHPPT